MDKPILVSIGVGGVWIRRRGGENDQHAKVEVLVEMGGEWRLLGSEPLDASFSHIWEPAGIESAPLDPLTTEPSNIDEGRWALRNAKRR